MMLELIDESYKGDYDFFYLPIDNKVVTANQNKCNVGYAFLNFKNLLKIRSFYYEFHNKKWKHFNSDKVCEIKYARICGLKALTDHFKHSNIMNQQVVSLDAGLKFEAFRGFSTGWARPDREEEEESHQ